MSSNKRKRSGDDGQAQDDIPQKQKRRRSNGRKAATDLAGQSSPSKSQEDSNINGKVPEADTPNVVGEAKGAGDRQRGKRKSKKRHSGPVLEGSGAATSIQVEVNMGDGDPIPDGEGEVAKVTPEEQEIKRQRRREKRRKDKAERDAAEMNQETAKAEQEHGHHQQDMTSGVANAQEKLKKRHRSSRKEQSKGLIKSRSDRRSQHKPSSRKESRDKTAPIWRVSESTGGCMLRIDPLFSPSEE